METLTKAYRRLVFLPDDSVVLDDDVQTQFIPEWTRVSARAAMASGEGSFRAGVQLRQGPIDLSWTASKGCAVSSVYCENRIVLSGVLLSGRNPAADAEVLEMYLSSIRRTRPVAELTQGRATPFARLATSPERPLYGAILIPMVPRDRCDEIVAWHCACAAAYLWPES